MEVITKIIQELSQHTNKKLDECSQLTQSVNDQFTKELEPMKEFQSENQENKNQIKSLGNRSNQSENSILKIGDSDTFKAQVLSEILNATRELKKIDPTDARCCKENEAKNN